MSQATRAATARLAGHSLRITVVSAGYFVQKTCGSSWADCKAPDERRQFLSEYTLYRLTRDGARCACMRWRSRRDPCSNLPVLLTHMGIHALMGFHVCTQDGIMSPNVSSKDATGTALFAADIYVFPVRCTRDQGIPIHLSLIHI